MPDRSYNMIGIEPKISECYGMYSEKWRGQKSQNTQTEFDQNPKIHKPNPTKIQIFEILPNWPNTILDTFFT